MKITKSRLLQIIKEEVELHNRNKNENLYEFNIADLMEVLDEEEKTPNIEDAIAIDKKENPHTELEEKKDGRIVRTDGHKATKGTIKKLEKEPFEKVSADIARSTGLPKNRADKITGAALAIKRAKGIPHKNSSRKEEILFDPKTKKEVK